MAQLTFREGDYSGGTDLVMWSLRSKEFSQLAAEEEVGEILNCGWDLIP